VLRTEHFENLCARRTSWNVLFVGGSIQVLRISPNTCFEHNSIDPIVRNLRLIGNVAISAYSKKRCGNVGAGPRISYVYENINFCRPQTYKGKT